MLSAREQAAKVLSSKIADFYGRWPHFYFQQVC